MPSNRDIQARCAAFGFNPGPIDGIQGPRTRSAVAELMTHLNVDRPEDIFHPSGLHRIHWHWTAGAKGINSLELRSYNELIDHDGGVHEGKFPPIAQSTYEPRRGASHTRMANSGAIGMAVDCMAGAVERPFDPGSAPMTVAQLDKLAERTAFYCQKYDIPVSRFSTLSHAEIQPTLGIRQRFKWDICWIPGMEKPGDPIEVGDRIRAMVQQKMETRWAA